MVLGYKDRNKRFSNDDHVTIFFDKDNGFTGLHRTISDNNWKVYFRYSTEYFIPDNGLNNLCPRYATKQ
jgi:hypothetical protein